MSERQILERQLYDTINGDVAECPICYGMLTIVDGFGGAVILRCADDCTEDEIRRWLELPPRISHQLGARAHAMLMVSPTPAVWAALLRGEAVPLSSLDNRRSDRLGRR